MDGPPSSLIVRNTMIPKISTKLNIGSMISAASRLFNSSKRGETTDPAAAPSPLLHCDIPYGREFAGMAGRLKPHLPPLWLAMSVTGMGMSAFMNFRGFAAFFPNQPAPAGLTALMLEGFVIGTGMMIGMIGRANRRALPGLVIMAILFGGTSVELSLNGINAGVQQTQQRLNLPEYEREDAVKAEGVFAVSAAQTEDAAIHRIGNEISFFTKHGGAKGTAGGALSGYARDKQQRQEDLNGLTAKWHTLDFADSFAAAKTPDQIWEAMRHDYSAIQSLMAETNRLTSGRPIPMPAYPVPPDHRAEAAHSGENDATGANSLKHPSLLWLVTVPLAVVMDLGPMVVAATLRALESGDEQGKVSVDPEPDGNTESLSLEEDLDERRRRMRRVGDDMRTDPLGDACDGDIQAEIADFRSVERGAISNLKLMRAFENFEEEVAIVRDAAARIGIGPEAVREHLDDAFRRLQERRRREQQIQDKEHALRHEKRELEQKLQGAADRLAIVKQIAGIQAELNSMSGTNH